MMTYVIATAALLFGIGVLFIGLAIYIIGKEGDE